MRTVGCCVNIEVEITRNNLPGTVCVVLFLTMMRRQKPRDTDEDKTMLKRYRDIHPQNLGGKGIIRSHDYFGDTKELRTSLLFFLLEITEKIFET